MTAMDSLADSLWSLAVLYAVCVVAKDILDALDALDIHV